MGSRKPRSLQEGFGKTPVDLSQTKQNSILQTEGRILERLQHQGCIVAFVGGEDTKDSNASNDNSRNTWLISLTNYYIILRNTKAGKTIIVVDKNYFLILYSLVTVLCSLDDIYDHMCTYNFWKTRIYVAHLLSVVPQSTSSEDGGKKKHLTIKMVLW